jgi:predicted nuclease with RNAse H fold
MKKVAKNLFIGIDLGGWRKKTTGLCILEFRDQKLKVTRDYSNTCKVIQAKNILKEINHYLGKTAVIAVDSPLSFGPGKGKMRLYEKLLSTSLFRKEKLSPLPPILMPQIVEEGIWLCEELGKHDFAKDLDLIETFTTFVLGVCGSREKLVKNIEEEKNIKIAIPECKVSHQYSAFICSLVAFLHGRNLTNFIGYRDGSLIVPIFKFWTRKWQDNFRRAWQDKDYLKYQHLKTDIK